PISKYLNIKAIDNNYKVFFKIKRITILKKLMAFSTRNKTFDDSRIQSTDSPNMVSTSLRTAKETHQASLDSIS
ncbi:hypothetical protein BDZ45DRAFT_606336, partial [Acephala macrosclerotiorum]